MNEQNNDFQIPVQNDMTNSGTLNPPEQVIQNNQVVEQPQVVQPSQSQVTQPQVAQTLNQTITAAGNNQNQTEEGLTDGDLMSAYIGKNYDKLVYKPFNWSCFFFSFFYAFYRKMFGFAIIIIVITAIIQNYIFSGFISNIALSILFGFLVNRVYLTKVHKAVIKIKTNNKDKSDDELLKICSKKGGTSVLSIILGVIIVFTILFIFAFFEVLSQFNINKLFSNESTTTIKHSEKMENIDINGYSCFNSKCEVTINNKKYKVDKNISDFFIALRNYEEYIEIDALFIDDTISSYNIRNKATGKTLDVHTEEELLKELGLYTIGEHVEVLKLVDYDGAGFSLSDGKESTYEKYIFENNDGKEFEMKLIDSKDQKLNIDEYYKVTFEVKEGMFDKEYIIKSIGK